MEVIRTVKNIRSSRITLTVPPSMRHRKIEILFLPVEETEMEKERTAQTRKLSSFLKFAKDHQVKLPGDYKFNREELHERDIS